MKWYTLKEAASYLGISERQLRHRCSQRMIKHRREGTRGRGRAGDYLFLHEWLNDYIAMGTIPLSKRFSIHPEVTKRKVRIPCKQHIPESQWGSSLDWCEE